MRNYAVEHGSSFILPPIISCWVWLWNFASIIDLSISEYALKKITKMEGSQFEAIPEEEDIEEGQIFVPARRPSSIGPQKPLLRHTGSPFIPPCEYGLLKAVYGNILLSIEILFWHCFARGNCLVVVIVCEICAYFNWTVAVREFIAQCAFFHTISLYL